MRVSQRQGDLRVSLSAAGVAFWVALAVLPGALAAVSVFGLFISPKMLGDALETITSSHPNGYSQFVAEQIVSLAGTDRRALSIGLIVSILLSLWSVSTAVYSMVRAIRAVYGLGPAKYVAARLQAMWVAFVVVVVFTLLIFAIAGYVTFSNSHNGLFAALMDAFGSLLMIIIITLMIAAVMRIAVERPIQRVPLIIGTFASAIAVVAIFVGFGLYVSVSTRSAATYGALAGIVLSLVATYTAIYAILLGVITTAELEQPPPAGPPPWQTWVERRHHRSERTKTSATSSKE